MCSREKRNGEFGETFLRNLFFVGERSSHCAGYIQEPSASDEEVVYEHCPSAIPAKPSSLSVLMENRAAATRWPDSKVQRHWWRPHHWRSRGQSGGCQSETPQIPWTPAALWRRLLLRTEQDEDQRNICPWWHSCHICCNQGEKLTWKVLGHCA